MIDFNNSENLYIAAVRFEGNKTKQNHIFRAVNPSMKEHPSKKKDFALGPSKLTTTTV
jgi:hypothetical protein